MKFHTVKALGSLSKWIREKRMYDERNSIKFTKGVECIDSLRYRKIVTSGDFFPTSEQAFREKMRFLEVDIQVEMDSNTEILICGRFPDWKLISEARKSGVILIFVDKVSDLFSLMRSNINKNVVEKAFLPEAPLGV